MDYTKHSIIDSPPSLDAPPSNNDDITTVIMAGIQSGIPEVVER
jgi:hypothetical protein